VRILVVEDEVSICRYVVKGLREAGHTVDQVDNGPDGLFMALNERFDAIVLDRMLPGMDGIDVLKQMRAKGCKTPVLILSAMAAVEDRVEGLKEGCDDYLTKPFSFSELMARLDVLIRRCGTVECSKTQISAGTLEIDTSAHRVRRDGVEIPMQPQEFRVLEYLMRNQGALVTRSMLIERVWNYHFDPDTNVIDVHISRLRRKIDPEDAKQSFIETIRGEGYILHAR